MRYGSLVALHILASYRLRSRRDQSVSGFELRQTDCFGGYCPIGVEILLPFALFLPCARHGPTPFSLF